MIDEEKRLLKLLKYFTQEELRNELMRRVGAEEAREMARNSPQTKFQGDVIKILKVIEDAGPEGVRRAELSKKASDRFRLNRDQLHNKDKGIIAHLIKQENIAILRKEGKTKPTEIYVYLKPLN